MTRPLSTRTVLICVLGTSPQIVTETLYALTQQEGVQPDAIHIWTTQIGEEVVRAQLLDRHTGKFFTFCEDYNVPDLPLPQVHVFRDALGTQLGDIRSDEDNAAMLDQLADFLRREAAVPGTRLLCSVAGGRKTMGIALALALQLHGRPGDRLFHVLVRPAEFEHLPDFFYPPPKPVTLIGHEGKPLNTADAVVELAEVPLVLLREQLPDMAGDAASLSYSELVHHVQQQLLRQARGPSLEINVAEQRVIIGDTVVELSPVQIALYALLADRRRRCTHTGADRCARCSVSSQELRSDDTYAVELRENLKQWLTRIPKRPRREDELERWTDEGPDVRAAVLRETVSKLNGVLRETLGAGRWVSPYLISSGRQKDTTLYGLLLPSHNISFLS